MIKELQRNVRGIVEAGNARMEEMEAKNARMDTLQMELEAARARMEGMKIDTEAAKARMEEMEATFASTDALQMELNQIRESRFEMCRANLLTALVKKLCTDTGKTIPDTHESTEWNSLAKSFSETEVKRATQDFKICQNSAAVITVLDRYSDVSRKPRGFFHNSALNNNLTSM